ncbi:MAG TPA: ATP-binding protein, partial [Actinomycetes bacterium]|nr:ATP-binding protein [Actinomycetes bacterium]
GALFGWVWWFGDVMRVRRARERQLAERTMLLEREREENARRAVLDERVRIARELHDVVAHSVSVMVVQAGAARRTLAISPGQATAALSPQPSLAHLESLAAAAREAGLPVEVVVEGEPRPLPAGVDLSAYRIVQEALTNAVRHAGPGRARVLVRYGEDCLEVQVRDDGGSGPARARDPADGRSGQGLVGMRERVNLFGGELHAGPGPGGGFTVDARLPLREPGP